MTAATKPIRRAVPIGAALLLDLAMGLLHGVVLVALDVLVAGEALMLIDPIPVQAQPLLGLAAAVEQYGYVLVLALMLVAAMSMVVRLRRSTGVERLQPLRRRVQRSVDRRFDRARYDGEGIVDAFAEGLRGQVDLAGLQGDVIRTVGVARRPSMSTLWLRDGRNGAAR